MKRLECKCGDFAEWVEITTVIWQTDAWGEREIKISEKTFFQCTNCNKMIYDY